MYVYAYIRLEREGNTQASLCVRGTDRFSVDQLYCTTVKAPAPKFVAANESKQD